MRLDFICPGMAKCGTTTLHDILKQHPNICVPSTIKEPLWLQDYNFCTNRDVNWYAEHYYGISNRNPQRDDVLYGEINPSFGVISAKRLHDFFRKCKIIFLFRNPVERLWSHFNMHFKRSTVMLSELDNQILASCESQTLAFSQFCNTNFERIGNKVKYTGTYSYTLAQTGYEFNCKIYLKYFGRENIKVILFEDFVKDPEKVCKELYAFLGVGDYKAINYSIKSNIGNYSVVTKKERCLITELDKKRRAIMKNGHSEEIKEFMKERELIEMQISDKARNKKKEHPSQECVEMLQEYFSDDKKYVEEYLQRDLSKVWF